MTLSSGLSTKEKIKMVNEIRDRINRASNLLSGHLSKLTTEDDQENEQHIQRIKREIRIILTQLAKFSDFCSRSTKNDISRLSAMGTEFTMFQSIRMIYWRRRLIDLWSSHVLTLTGINTNKWPLELEVGITAKIKKLFDVYLKAKTKRPT